MPLIYHITNYYATHIPQHSSIMTRTFTARVSSPIVRTVGPSQPFRSRVIRRQGSHRREDKYTAQYRAGSG
ncbi:hypothetical protein RRG08_028609 [Elysia crispata]|uniref:Uncharacterized protein n=1 Tax=Elysia crispata TaxID=231223 RepID=A0AAE0ZST1_9GAST|nr:hypothetical protein RRG08_028609 [Elysia crispata]